MKFYVIFFNKILILLFHITPLYGAVQKGSADAVKLLVKSENIDPNILCILVIN